MLVFKRCLRDINVVASVEHGSYIYRRESAVSVELDHIAGLPVDRIPVPLVEIGIHFGIMQWVRRWPAAFEVPARLVSIAVVLYERPHPHLLAGARDGCLPQKRFV